MQQAQLSDDEKVTFVRYVTECKAKEGASDDDIKRHIIGMEAKTMPGKCLVACLHEAVGLVSAKNW